MHLVALFQAAENSNRVFLVGLVNQHLLKTAFQGGVLLDILPVFIERSRTDTVQLAPGEGRLEHIAGIHGPLRLTGADHGV